MKTIFVSSTFKDMQQERDALQRITLPNINAQAKKYGESVAFCDLRWGVNTSNLTEEESNKKVLNVCLDVIDRCEPIMIVILGERYGWQPGSEEILTASKRKDMQLADYEISVTALEIEYGSFYKKAKTLVYCRNIQGDIDANYLAEDDSHAQKLQALKQRLSTFAYGGLRNYTVKMQNGVWQGVDDFAKMVQNDVIQLLSDQWQSQQDMSQFGKNLLINQGIFRENSKNFVTGHSFADKIATAIAGDEQIINIIGDAGSGKSTLMGRLFTQLTDIGYEVLPLQVGSTAELSTNVGILNYLLDFFKERCQMTCYLQDDEQAQENAFEEDINDVSLNDIYRTFLNRQQLDTKLEMLADYAEQYEDFSKKLVILIDGLENLHDDQGEIDGCYIPSNLQELSNICFVITSKEKRVLHGDLQLPMPLLEENQMLSVMCGILHRNHRELATEVAQKVMEKCVGKTPLYLKLLIQRLLMMNWTDFAVMGDMQAISTHQTDIIATSCDSVEQLAVQVLLEGAQRVNGNFILPMLQYLAITREGLTEQEVMALLPSLFDKGDFYGFITYMSDFFLLRQNGRYDFANAIVKGGILQQISRKGDVAQGIVQLLCDEFFEVEVLQQKPDYSIIQEIVHLCSTYCDGKLFVKIANDFLRFDEKLQDAKNAVRYQGAKYATFVFTMCFEENASALLDIMLQLVEQYPTYDDATQKQVLSILDMYYDAKVSGSDVFVEPYFRLLATLQNDIKHTQILANLTYDMLVQADINGAKTDLSKYANMCLEYENQYFVSILDTECDFFEVVGDLLCKLDKAVSLTYDDPQTVEKINEHITFYQNYFSNLLAQLQGSVAEEVLDMAGGYLLQLLYFGCKLLENNDTEQNALMGYIVFISAYQNLSPAYQQNFHQSADVTLGKIYHTLARLYTSVGKDLQEESALQTALIYLEQAHELDLAEDEYFADSDMADYLLQLADLLQLLGSKQNKKRENALKKILKLKEKSLYVMGKKLKANEQLFQMTENLKYATEVISIAKSMVEYRLENYPDMTAEEVLDLVVMAVDIAQFKIYVNDGTYLSRAFAKDVQTAIAMCSLFENNKAIIQTQSYLINALKSFEQQ